MASEAGAAVQSETDWMDAKSSSRSSSQTREESLQPLDKRLLSPSSIVPSQPQPGRGSRLQQLGSKILQMILKSRLPFFPPLDCRQETQGGGSVGLGRTFPPLSLPQRSLEHVDLGVSHVLLERWSLGFERV